MRTNLTGRIKSKLEHLARELAVMHTQLKNSNFGDQDQLTNKEISKATKTKIKNIVSKKNEKKIT